MKKLFLSLLLTSFSIPSFGKVGDTYQCNMLHFSNITPDGIFNQPLEEFNFIRKQDEIKFIADGYFSYWRTPVNSQSSNDMLTETFTAGDITGGIVIYRDGNFGFNYLAATRAHTILAKCEIE